MNNTRQYRPTAQGTLILCALCVGLVALAWPTVSFAHRALLAMRMARHVDGHGAVARATSELASIEVTSVDLVEGGDNVSILRVGLLNRSTETIVAVHFVIGGTDPNTEVGYATRMARDRKPGEAMMGPSRACSVEIPAGNVKPGESLVLDAALFASGSGDGTKDSLAGLRDAASGGESREP